MRDPLPKKAPAFLDIVIKLIGKGSKDI
uniref:Uncharacterized protein n=1 Tax=Romanomermis culicivorax TaxID=13658 RepID=A0A915HKH6_ROMCU